MITHWYTEMSSWRGTLTALLVVSLWWAVNVLPTSDYWLEPHSMIVADFEVGEDPTLVVYREIHRSVFGEWSTTIRKAEQTGWVIYCAASGSNRYKPEAQLPEPTTLNWWSNGQCSIDEPGQYYITTTWTLFPDWAASRRTTTPLVSNVFEGEECEPNTKTQERRHGALPCDKK